MYGCSSHSGCVWELWCNFPEDPILKEWKAKLKAESSRKGGHVFTRAHVPLLPQWLWHNCAWLGSRNLWQKPLPSSTSPTQQVRTRGKKLELLGCPAWAKLPTERFGGFCCLHHPLHMGRIAFSESVSCCPTSQRLKFWFRLFLRKQWKNSYPGFQTSDSRRCTSPLPAPAMAKLGLELKGQGPKVWPQCRWRPRPTQSTPQRSWWAAKPACRTIKKKFPFAGLWRKVSKEQHR